jgi:uncharacterized protein (TIGR02217 family)
MAFYETPEFPSQIAFGAVGGPRFSTDIVETDGGDETRNQNWSQARAEYTVDLNNKTKAQRDALIAHFRAVGAGRANGFRLKDWSDYQVAITEGVFTALGADVYQLVKRYTSGSATYDRKIYKPVSPLTSVLTAGGTPLVAGSHYTLDSTTGRLTMIGSPTFVPATWSGEFRVPVRYDTDYLGLRAIAKDSSGAILSDAPGIKLVETREIA